MKIQVCEVYFYANDWNRALHWGGILHLSYQARFSRTTEYEHELLRSRILLNLRFDPSRRWIRAIYRRVDSFDGKLWGDLVNPGSMRSRRLRCFFFEDLV